MSLNTISDKDARIKELEMTFADLEKELAIEKDSHASSNAQAGRFERIWFEYNKTLEARVMELEEKITSLKGVITYHEKREVRQTATISDLAAVNRAYQDEIVRVCTHTAELEAQLAQGGEPVAYMYQHEDTGLVGFIDKWQIENGFQEANPRLRVMGPVYTRPAPDAEVMRDAARYKWIRDTARGEPASAEFWPAIELRMPQYADIIWCNQDDLDKAVDDAISEAARALNEYNDNKAEYIEKGGA